LPVSLPRLRLLDLVPISFSSLRSPPTRSLCLSQPPHFSCCLSLLYTPCSRYHSLSPLHCL
ncbi:hypothetical protein ACLOJK_024020, partial [Asimina triloba]